MNIQQLITKKNTRTEILLSEIENLIVNGSMVPGQRLDEMVLAKKYGVSRTPVREAIRALTAIGLVQNTGRQGSQVAKLSISMLIEMFELMEIDYELTEDATEGDDGSTDTVDGDNDGGVRGTDSGVQ